MGLKFPGVLKFEKLVFAEVLLKKADVVNRKIGCFEFHYPFEKDTCVFLLWRLKLSMEWITYGASLFTCGIGNCTWLD